MPRTPLYPLTFQPVLKDYIWGGRNLARKLGRELPEEKAIAESWEIGAHPNGTTEVAAGSLAGQPLTALVETYGADLIGTNGKWALDRGKFPLLVKLLDATQHLSVQVHPNDEYALAHEGNELGKTEMWVVLHAEPEAAIILGVAGGTSQAQFGGAAEAGKLEELLHTVPVRTGDHVCVPAGTLHAILGGLLIAEIQQNSDTTYRVYDWGRVGKDGSPRPTHLAQALEVINFEQVEPQLPAQQMITNTEGMRRELLCRNQYFTVERLHLDESHVFEGECDGSTLEVWGVISGTATFESDAGTVTAEAVRFVLLPATLGQFNIRSGDTSTLLRAYLSEA